MSQILYIGVGGWVECGGCLKGIKDNAIRAYVFRGGTNAKGFHVLCALKELNASKKELIDRMKHYGTTKGKRMYQFR